MLICIWPYCLSLYYRSFGDVIRNPVSLDYFKRFLRFHYAQGALLFTLEVEKLRAIDRPKPQKIKILAIVNKFLRREDPSTVLKSLFIIPVRFCLE